MDWIARKHMMPVLCVVLDAAFMSLLRVIWFATPEDPCRVISVTIGNAVQTASELKLKPDVGQVKVLLDLVRLDAMSLAIWLIDSMIEGKQKVRHL